LDYVFYFNVFEAVLWTALGIYAVVLATRFATRSKERSATRSEERSATQRLLLIAVVFWIFAGSEVMETQTGAWWKPWWLAVWKGGCIAVLITLGTRHYRWHNHRPPSSDGPSRPPADEQARGQ